MLSPEILMIRILMILISIILMIIHQEGESCVTSHNDCVGRHAAGTRVPG